MRFGFSRASCRVAPKHFFQNRPKSFMQALVFRPQFFIGSPCATFKHQGSHSFLHPLVCIRNVRHACEQLQKFASSSWNFGEQKGFPGPAPSTKFFIFERNWLTLTVSIGHLLLCTEFRYMVSCPNKPMSNGHSKLMKSRQPMLMLTLAKIHWWLKVSFKHKYLKMIPGKPINGCRCLLARTGA